MKSHCLRLALLLALSGCATPYAKQGLWGTGFNESQLSEDTFSVSFSGNGHTTDERAQDYLFLRCADVTIEHGGKFFRLVGTADASRNGGAMLMNGNTAMFAPIHFPHQTAMIQVRQDKEGPQDFDAAFVAKNMRAKYGMK